MISMKWQKVDMISPCWNWKWQWITQVWKILNRKLSTVTTWRRCFTLPDSRPDPGNLSMCYYHERGRGCRASLKTVVLSWRLHLILGCGWNGRLSPGFFRRTEWHNLIIYWNIKEDFYLLFKEERIVGPNDEAISTGSQTSREWRS